MPEWSYFAFNAGQLEVQGVFKDERSIDALIDILEFGKQWMLDDRKPEAELCFWGS